MDQSHVVLFVIGVALISSGCIGGEADNGGGLNIGPGGKTITVTDFVVQPNSILAGSSTQVKLGIVNTGGMSSEVTVSSDSSNNQGREVLVNNCPDIFSVSSFDAESSKSSDVETSYELEPGGELQLSWSLKNDNSDIPLNGYTCPLRFQVPFDYGVTAYQQLEVKENDEVQGATTLESRTSEGPLNIHLETIGSTSEQGAPKFIQGDNKEVLIQLENTAPKQSSYQGLVDLKSPKLRVSDNFMLDASSCNMETNADDELVKSLKIDKNMRLYQGQSRVIRCDIETYNTEEGRVVENSDEMPQPSMRGQATAELNYTYVKDLGEKSIEVRYRG